MEKENLSLDQFLPYRLSVAANKVSKKFAQVYSKKFGITIPEWRVIAVVGLESGICADDVCDRTEMEKVAVSRAIAKLLEKTLLDRQFSSTDRRRSVLSLSSKGRRTYQQIILLARSFEDELVADFSEQEIKKLTTMLATFSAD